MLLGPQPLTRARCPNPICLCLWVFSVYQIWLSLENGFKSFWREQPNWQGPRLQKHMERFHRKPGLNKTLVYEKWLRKFLGMCAVLLRWKKTAFFPLCWMGFIRERLPLVTQDVNQGLHEAHAPFVPPQSMLGKHVEFVNLWGIPWKNEVGKKDELLTQGCCKTMKHFWLSCALCQSIRECYHSWIKCRTRLAARCLIWYGNRSKPLHSNICMIKKS